MSQGQDTRKTTWSRPFHVGKFHGNSHNLAGRPGGRMMRKISAWVPVETETIQYIQSWDCSYL